MSCETLEDLDSMVVYFFLYIFHYLSFFIAYQATEVRKKKQAMLPQYYTPNITRVFYNLLNSNNISTYIL